MASISKALIWIDRKLDFLVILYLFLGLFWLLNGFDKFFNSHKKNRSNILKIKFRVQGKIPNFGLRVFRL